MPDALVIEFAQLRLKKHISMQPEQCVGFALCFPEISGIDQLRQGKQLIRDALHCGDHNRDARSSCSLLHETRRVQHALRAKERSAAELERDDVSLRFGRKLRAYRFEHAAALFIDPFTVWGFLLDVLRTHDNRSLGLWFPRAAAFAFLEGVKTKPAARFASGGGFGNFG